VKRILVNANSKQKPERGPNMSKETTINVGRKPLMNYVLAVVTAFNESNAERVVLRARGKGI